jgi:hypothetical protein
MNAIVTSWLIHAKEKGGGGHLVHDDAEVLSVELHILEVELCCKQTGAVREVDGRRTEKQRKGEGGA